MDEHLKKSSSPTQIADRKMQNEKVIIFIKMITKESPRIPNTTTEIYQRKKLTLMYLFKRLRIFKNP